jgi:O-antigen ligase
MEHPDLAQVAAVAAAVGSALALLGRARLALLAGLAVLAAAEAGLALSLGGLPVDRVATASGVAAAGVGALALLGSAALLARWPAAVPIAVLAAAPLRPPLDFDSSHRFLISVVSDGRLGRLLPLYFVLAAAGLALAWRTLRSEQPRPLPPAIAYPATAFFVLAFLSLLWASDVDAAVNTLLFFTLPFALLLAVLSRAPAPSWLPRALAITGLTLAALFAAVGLWQAATHEVFFFAPNLQVANANTDFFRVTSLFGDPSLYGRHVVLGMCIALAALATSRIDLRIGIGLLALMWAGLFFSYSQTSMATLLVVTLGLAVVTGDRRVRRAVPVTAAVVVVALGGYVAVKTLTGESLNQVTSDRLQRVEQTLVVVRDRPFVGVGIGGQPRASRRLEHSDRPTTNFASHTTPLTVAAELGILGLALYAWLLVGGARLLASVTRLHRTLGLTLVAAFLALFVHALSYSGFLEDPLTWVVLAVGAAWLTGPHREEREQGSAGPARATLEPEPAPAGGS